MWIKKANRLSMGLIDSGAKRLLFLGLNNRIFWWQAQLDCDSCDVVVLRDIFLEHMLFVVPIANHQGMIVLSK